MDEDSEMTLPKSCGPSVPSDCEKSVDRSTGLPPMLPPCRVCGDKASGLHYGANTCEACKAFFRRTLKKETVNLPCTCTGEPSSVDENAPARKITCPQCRYKRCLIVGMSKDAIKIGRYTLARKSDNIREVKKLKTKDLQDIFRSDEYEIPSLHSGSDLVPEKSGSRTTRNSLLSCSCESDYSSLMGNYSDNSKREFSDGSSDDLPSAKRAKSNSSYNLSEEEINKMILTLVRAQKVLQAQDIDFYNEEVLGARQRAYFEQYKLKKELFGDVTTLTDQEYEDFYKNTGINIDNRNEVIQCFVAYLDSKITRIVSFAKSVPGFSTFPVEDQASLLKAARFECGMLSWYRGVNTDLNIAATMWGKEYHFDEIKDIVGKDYLAMKFQYARKLQNLKLSFEEEALLRGIVLTFTDRCELQCPEKVSQVQWNLIECLMYILKKKGEINSGRLAKMFDVFINIRELTDLDDEVAKNTIAGWSELHKYPLVRELLSV
ncbi:hypothetical protein CHS0354_011335 [Potamilus streckersoni]|uniref:Uncharacterized protein n=1 Tax=Potamilus streckersoni TaxID=2493646 RepID=A0AAE0TG50_9BIVA|nr:hypothetical protein CHS0354_011335 [Potamilus streckersoni]